MSKNPEVFPGKTFTDVLKDIYDNTTSKRSQIEEIMKSLVNLIQGSAANAAIVAPLLKELLEVSVKNDEHVVKVATLIQRLMSSEIQTAGEHDDTLLTDDEKNKLLLETSEKDAFADLNAAIREADHVKALKQQAATTQVALAAPADTL